MTEHLQVIRVRTRRVKCASEEGFEAFEVQAAGEIEIVQFAPDGVQRFIYSGSGWPLVSGANGKAARPTMNTRHMVTPA